MRTHGRLEIGASSIVLPKWGGVTAGDEAVGHSIGAM